jgi:AraC-like DNA-binding protein
VISGILLGFRLIRTALQRMIGRTMRHRWRDGSAMLAKYENRLLGHKEKVWVGQYRNLHNLPHWHLECELIHLDQGEASISINNQTYPLYGGQTLFCGSGEIHSIRGDANSVLSVFLFDASMVREILDRFQLADALLRHRYDIGACFASLCAELAAKEPFYEVRTQCCIADLMANIFRTEERIPVRDLPADSTISRYKALLQEIDAKYNYITFDDAANFMGLSRNYFSTFFHDLSGMTFSRYRNIVRVEKSVGLLRDASDARSVTQIATLCGFDTIRHFNRVFRSITGTNPKKLPRSYALNIRPLIPEREVFDPTLGISELLGGSHSTT